MIFLVPLLMGGRHAIGQLALTVLAVAAAWAWAARAVPSRRRRAGGRRGRRRLILAGLALVVLQTVPLAAVAAGVVGAAHRRDPAAVDAADDSPRRWASGPASRSRPPKRGRAWCCFWISPCCSSSPSQRIRRIEDVERLLRWCALSAVGMAVFGIVQLLTGNGKFFWFYEHPFSDTSTGAKGSFSNRNHFAHFLALGDRPADLVAARRHAPLRARTAGPPALDRHRAELKTYLLGLALGVVLFAGLLSLSRGGIAAMFLAAAICTAICYRAASLGRPVPRRAGRRRRADRRLAWHLRPRPRQQPPGRSLLRLARTAGSFGRAKDIWAAAAKAVADHLLLGTGVGSFREVFPMYTDALLVRRNRVHPCREQPSASCRGDAASCGLALTLAGIAFCVVSWCVGGVMPSVPVRSAALCGGDCGEPGRRRRPTPWSTSSGMCRPAWRSWSFWPPVPCGSSNLAMTGSGIRVQGSGFRVQGMKEGERGRGERGR